MKKENEPKYIMVCPLCRKKMDYEVEEGSVFFSCFDCGFFSKRPLEEVNAGGDNEKNKNIIGCF